MHAALLAQLKQFPVPSRYIIALSGGCDSVALLHAVQHIQSQLDCQEILAVHIDHGLLAESATWADQCRQLCAQYHVPLTVIELNLTIPKGESVEAVARHARYVAFKDYLQDNDMLLLAHHENDQAETLLLQVLRGSGVNGLSCMPAITQLAKSWLARPLLNFTRDEIESYAREHQLPWIDDPSNRDPRFDRNFLRHEVLPVLSSRWPSVTATLSRVAQHQAEAKHLLLDLAQIDWQLCQTPEPRRLSVPALMTLSPARMRNVLRYWLQHICQVPLPDTRHLQRILDEVLPAAVDAAPQIHWANVQLRRYRDELYIESLADHIAQDWHCNWDMRTPLLLPTGEILHSRTVSGRGLLLTDAARPIMVRYRQGGERCRLPGRHHRHELKKLFQNWGVPPWRRDRIPLIYIGQELAQIVGYSVCEPFMAHSGQSGVEIYLQA